jgi:hypothetical protein
MTLMGKYATSKAELKREVEKCRNRKGRILRIPVATNIRIVDGKLNYDVEEYLEIPENIIPGKQSLN